MSNLTGKVVIVTGGSRGIGESIVRRLCEDGATVYATFNSNEERAREIENSINRKLESSKTRELETEPVELGTRHVEPGNVFFDKVDVTDEVSAKAYIESVVTRATRIDGLVNNAGITRDGLIMRMSTADWEDVIKTNLTGTFFMCRAVARQMMSQRAGRVVNIGSIVGLGGNAGQVNYSSAKAGLVGLTRSLAKELASRNVLVNCVAPGFVETDMTGKLTDEQRAAYTNSIPLKRIAKADEISQVVSFLLSDAAAYITGQVINVDGGLAL